MAWLRPLRRAVVFALASACALVVACSSLDPALRPAGTSCAADGDCGAGLSCLAIEAPGDGGGCATIARACSRSCRSDNDCAPLGGGFRCLLCGGAGACVATP